MNVDCNIKDKKVFTEKLEFLKISFKKKPESHEIKKKYSIELQYSKKEKNGFLDRVPEKIKEGDLLNRGFLLNKKNRKSVLSFARQQKKSNKREMRIYLDPGSPYGKFFYMSENHQIFMGSHQTYLGEGSYGKVYAVQHMLTGRWYCMKKLKDGALKNSEIDALAEEGMLLISEQSYDYDIFISQLIHGKNLDVFLKEITEKKRMLLKEPLSPDADIGADKVFKNSLKTVFSFEEALALNISLVEAYESLQRKGYVHRDIKLANIMFDEKQRKCFAVDFGFVASVKNTLKWCGTLGYSSPEAFSSQGNAVKKLDLRDDIYAIGLVAANIIGLSIDNIDVYNLQDKLNYYEKLSLDINESTKERYEYLKETYQFMSSKRPALQTFLKYYLNVFPVIFGAKDINFQKSKKLSAEAITLCRLIYQMTEPRANRPSINEILKKMRQIRLEQIEHKMRCFETSFEDSCSYNHLLKEMYARRAFLSRTPNALDHLENFLLRAVDSNQENRPTVEEAKQYLAALNETLSRKKTVNADIEEYAFKKPENTESLAQKIQVLEKRCALTLKCPVLFLNVL